MELAGLVVKASLVAVPPAMTSGVLVAGVSPVEAAVRVYVPALSMLQPVKPAIPEEALTGFWAQVRTAPEGVVMLKLTGAVLPVMVLPPASWIATAGWVPRAVL